MSHPVRETVDLTSDRAVKQETVDLTSDSAVKQKTVDLTSDCTVKQEMAEPKVKVENMEVDSNDVRDVTEAALRARIQELEARQHRWEQQRAQSAATESAFYHYQLQEQNRVLQDIQQQLQPPKQRSMPVQHQHQVSYRMAPGHTHEDVDRCFGLMPRPMNPHALRMLERTSRDLKFERAQQRLDLQRREEEANDQLWAQINGYYLPPR